VEVAGKISYDPIVTDAMVVGKPIVEHSPGHKISQEIETVWRRVLAVLNK